MTENKDPYEDSKSLLSESVDDPPSERRYLPVPRSTFGPAAVAALAGLIGLIVGVLAGGAIHHQAHQVSKALVGFEVLQPAFSSVHVKFNRENVWERPLGDPDGDRAWNNMVPPSDGYVEIEAPASYGLNVLEGKESQGAFGISVFHQLHCLHLIRDSYFRLKEGGQPTKTEGHHKHCFNFIRQALKCAGDTTLEPFADVEPGRQAQLSWDTVHQCRDWDAIYQFAVEGYNGTNSGDE